MKEDKAFGSFGLTSLLLYDPKGKKKDNFTFLLKINAEEGL